MECPVCSCLLSESPDSKSPKKKLKTEDGILETSNVICTPCGHVFHRSCILTWFSHNRDSEDSEPDNGTCPTCRTCIDTNEMHPVDIAPLRQNLTPTPESNNYKCVYDEWRNIQKTYEALSEHIRKLEKELEEEQEHAELSEILVRSFNEVKEIKTEKLEST